MSDMLEEFKNFIKAMGFRDFDPADREHIFEMRGAWSAAWTIKDLETKRLQARIAELCAMGQPCPRHNEPQPEDEV